MEKSLVAKRNRKRSPEQYTAQRRNAPAEGNGAGNTRELSFVDPLGNITAERLEEFTSPQMLSIAIA